MLISTIVPIGNYTADNVNLKKIIELSKSIPVELIFVLDSDEEIAVERLSEQCQLQEISCYKIIRCMKRNPGASRNLGILSATGDWITFCDSDDLPYFLNIVSAISKVKANCDILVGNFEVENLNSGEILEQNMPTSTNSIHESISLQPGIWRWIIRRSFLSDLYFPELSMGEDQYFIFKILSRNPIINFSSEVFYRYRTGGRISITSSKAKINDLILIIKFELIQRRFPKKYSSLKNNMIIRQILTLLKNGNKKGKLFSLVFFMKYLYLISPREYLRSIKFILKAYKVSIGK